MLCKATEADLEQMVAFRRKTYGGTRQDALDWLCGIVGLDNILILARDPAPGAKPIPAAMDWCGSSGMRAPPRRMALLHGNGPVPAGARADAQTAGNLPARLFRQRV